MSVSRAQREIDSAEFAEWMAYAVWEPFGPGREDQRAGMIAALIANVNRDSAKRPEPYSVDDFFPAYEGAEAMIQRMIEADKPVVNLEDKLLVWAAKMADNKPTQGMSELRPK